MTRSIGCHVLLATAFHLSGSFVPDSPLSETPEKHAEKKGHSKLSARFGNNHNIIAQNFAIAFCQGIIAKSEGIRENERVFKCCC
ncbi:hypothetical protein BJY01DRAFT_69594 [Aspergillus pseudoustus]|uniref:Secreted protein n=1 Tax=Aspergillus pseudoustus TaxID=1810923 RepID=A0ABR4L055_9EURO